MKRARRLDDLENCFDDDKRAVIANDILQDIGRSKLAIEDVASRLRSDRVETRQAVAWILEESGKRCRFVAENILMGMRDSDSVVRTSCAKCLGSLEGKCLVPAVATLIFHLGDDFFVSCAAADSILIQLKYHALDVLENFGAVNQYLIEDCRLPSPEAARIAAILRQDQTCKDAAQGVGDESQRIALAWTIKAAATVPTLMSALAAGMNSRHESVAVLSADRLGREIDTSCSLALRGVLASRSRRASLALNHLAANMVELGDEIQTTLQVKNNGDIGAFADDKR